MTYCVKCGEKLTEGAQVCQRCGTPISSAQATTTRVERRDHTGLGSALILIGGVLAIVLNLVQLTSMILLQRSIQDLIRRSAIWSGMGLQGWEIHLSRLLTFITIGTVLSIILGVIALYAYKRVRDGEVRHGGIIAIVVAIILLALASWIPGTITLAGGLVCYTSRYSTL